MKKTSDPTLKIPAHAPVMVLPTVLMPHSLVPLHIFEARYRAMLAMALENDRMFCIAMVRRGVAEWTTPEDFHEVAGLGLVRACVGRPNGTSDLVLQGLVRVRFRSFVEGTPFPLAAIETLDSLPPEEHEASALTAKVLSLCARLRDHGYEVPEALDGQLAQIDDPEMLADVVAHTFIRDPFRRQDLLEEPRVGERLRLLVRHLSTGIVQSEES